MRCFLLLILLLSTINFANGQSFPSNGDKKTRGYFDEAREKIRERDLYKAVKLLQKAVARDSNFVDGHRQLAELGKILGDNRLLFKHTLRLADLKRGAPEEASLRSMLGQRLLQMGRYGDAANQFEKGLSTGQPILPELKQKMERGLVSSKFAREATMNPIQFTRKPLPPTVNRYPLQFTPSATADDQMLVYTARKGLSSAYDEDIYVSRKDAAGNWGPPTPIKGPINTPGNEGTTNISADGTALVFTSCERNGRESKCDIFISYSGGDVWSEPVSLDSANSYYWDSHPTLTADGNQVFFISQRPGGYGGSDLYSSIRRPNGKWSRAYNLGPAINTEEDETMPFMHTNGTSLFFASKGHPGMGGSDLFVAERSLPFYNQQDPAGQWGKPRNLGYPLNTSENESSIFILPNGEKAYYCVEQESQNGFVTSILFEMDLGKSLGIKNKSYYVKGTVKDKATGKPLYADIVLQQPATGTAIYNTESGIKNGQYLIVLPGGDRYRLAVSKPGYLFQSRSFDLSGEPIQNDLEMDFLLEPIVAGATTVLNNLFFESAKWELLPESQAELDAVIKLLKDNPKVKVEISGHTDDVGSDEANLALSKKRAQSIVDYLAGKGIVATRLVTKGLGETAPVTPNTSDEGRAKNRRIEFKIL